jgi:hypothetical protein
VLKVGRKSGARSGSRISGTKKVTKDVARAVAAKLDGYSWNFSVTAKMEKALKED